MKKILISSLRVTLQAGWRLMRGFWVFLTLGFAKPIMAVSRIVFRGILVPLYRVYRLVKNRVLDFFSPAKNKMIFPLLKRGMLHLTLFIISAGVIFANVGVPAIRAETFGQNSLVYNVVPQGEGEEVLEVVKSPAPKPIKYQQDFAGISVLSRNGGTDTTGQGTGHTILDTSEAVVKPTLTQATLPVKPREKVEFYTVQGGDTISTIAEEFGISVNTLLWENKLSTNTLIKPGQKLTILPVNGISHQVKKGDTVASIAKKYGVSEDSIFEYNQLADASDIETDEILIIPGGQPPAPPPTPQRITPSPGTQFATGPVPPSARVPAGSRLLWPTPGHKINQYFGFRHTGVDIDGDYSSPIWAADDGTVEYVSYQRYGYGYHIIINHGAGTKTLYGHASKIFVKPGDKVTKGQTIAMVGTTGRSTGTHLHFEVIIGGKKLNPLSYL